MPISRKDFILFLSAALFCAIVLCLTLKSPIGDFGNYYYGSRLWMDGEDVSVFYKDIHSFNELIKGYGQKSYFENYIPVPPFSLLFYYPFVFLKASASKIVFNILCAFIFCFSLIRFFKHYKLSGTHLTALVVLAFPLYANFQQGQSYLLIAAALFEIIIAGERKQYILAAFLIAIVFHLKIYPALVLFYFVVKRQYRVVAWSFLMILLIFIISGVVVGSEPVWLYWTQIVPRFFNNEIIDPYYYGHQGAGILLKNLFSYDELNNPLPLTNMPVLAIVVECLFFACVAYSTTTLVKREPGFKSYGIFLFAMVLISNYVPAYSLLLLLPYAIAQVSQKKFLPVVILFLGCNIPLSLLETMPIAIKYVRISLFICLFIYIVASERPAAKLWMFASLFMIICLIRFSCYNEEPNDYFLAKKQKGVYFEMHVVNDRVVLSRCLGEDDLSDTLLLPEHVEKITPLASHPLLVSKRQRVRDIYRINDKWLLYLSDLNQGVGMYQPRLQQPR